jgi:hypothetical protein
VSIDSSGTWFVFPLTFLVELTFLRDFSVEEEAPWNPFFAEEEQESCLGIQDIHGDKLLLTGSSSSCLE